MRKYCAIYLISVDISNLRYGWISGLGETPELEIYNLSLVILSFSLELSLSRASYPFVFQARDYYIYQQCKEKQCFLITKQCVLLDCICFQMCLSQHHCVNNPLDHLISLTNDWGCPICQHHNLPHPPWSSIQSM